MLLGEILKHYGINVKGMDKYESYEFWGRTPKENKFYMFKCNSFDKFTIYINDEVKATRCNFKTAIKLIKAN